MFWIMVANIKKNELEGAKSAGARTDDAVLKIIQKGRNLQ